MNPRTSRRKWLLFRSDSKRAFHQSLNVVDENCLEWRGIVKKVYLDRTKRLKKLFEQRKMRSRPATEQTVI